MPTADELFDEYGPRTAPDSPTRRRTIRQAADLRRGIHPATRVALAGNGETCGTCVHAIVQRHNRRNYWKCDLMPITAGAGSDIRISWPACTKWEDR